MLVTGKPGCGKTTLASRVAVALGSRAGGMLTFEVREAGRRVGFEVADIATGEKDMLAHINLKGAPRIGKYGVNLGALERVGVEAVSRALSEGRFVIIDEIGPMELLSARFVEVVERVFSSDRGVLATLHLRSRHPLVERLRSRKDVTLRLIDRSNRERVLREILEVVR